jgi:uncharacterized protein (TIGR03066 family)
MRLFLGCTTFLLMAATAVGQAEKTDTIDADKLVGRWGTPAKGKIAAMAPVEEFTKDGKYSTGTADGKLKIDGTYVLDGHTLTITLPANPGSPAEVHKWVIKKLTATTLTYTQGKQTFTLMKHK